MTHRTQPLQNKIAIIIDAAHGIGAEIARRLACAGAIVVVNYRSVQRQAAQKVEEEIFATGGRAWAVPANPGSEMDVQFLLEQTAQGFGEPDIIVITGEWMDSKLLDRFGAHAYKIWLLQSPSCIHQPYQGTDGLAADAVYELRRTINAAALVARQSNEDQARLSHRAGSFDEDSANKLRRHTDMVQA